ncbi:MAG: CxxC-x17-CxxC domain-containing protein [bacterium]
MGNFQGGKREGGFRGGDRGGRPSFGNKGFGGNRGGDRGGDRDTMMHKATCSECGKTCEVPFRPNGDKPVFCNDCFGAKREGGQGGDRGPKRDFGNKFEKRTSNTNFEQRPSFAKPASDNGDTKKALSEISTKLDRLISAIEKMSQPKPVTVATKAPVAKVVESKTVAKVVAKAPAKKEVKAPAKKVATKKVVAKKKK